MLASSSAAVLAQAKSPSSVLLYTSVPQQLATQFADAFMKKRPDIKVEIYRAGSTEVGAKIAAEREVGGIRADLLWLADAPKSWKEFPEHGKKAVMGNPLYSGSNFVTVAAFVQKDGWGWFERARATGVAIVRGNSEAATALAGKEFGVAMTLDYLIAGLIRKGAPLAIVWPSEGAISVPSPIAIIKGTKNPNGSKAFVDYVLSKEGQEFLVKQEAIPARGDVKPPAGQPSAKQIKFLPIPYEWAADNAPAIREKFEKLMLQ